MTAARYEVEQWGVFERQFAVPSATDVGLEATFVSNGRVFVAASFADGPGLRTIRFMPDEPGTWEYTVSSTASELDGESGSIICTAAGEGNHGPVRVNDGARFGYADGTDYIPYGTTARDWHLQDGQTRARTLKSLAGMPFTKVRMELQPGAELDTLRLLESGVEGLRELGIEAEIVVSDPTTIAEAVSRLAAYRNVWWCVANERAREELGRLIREYDYGRHLLSVHGDPDTDFGAPWITHVSLRHDEVRIISDVIEGHRKPVVLDVCGAEGDGASREESLPPEEMVLRVWEGMCRGGYVTHAEWYVADGRSPWSRVGGELAGASVTRIGYLRRILEQAPAAVGYVPMSYASTLEASGEYYLQYCGPHRFPERPFALPSGDYQVDLIDTWNMTTRRLAGTFSGEFGVELPSELYYAVRIQRSRREEE